MAMTRKDYETIAGVLRSDATAEMTRKDYAVLVKRICYDFRRANDTFDSDRFKTACRVGTYESDTV